MRSSEGAGEATFEGRRVNPADVAVPAGYRIEPVTTGLTFPTGIAFDQDNTPYVVEAGYSYGEVWTTPRLLRINPNGTRTPIAEGGKNGPWTGVCHQDGVFYVAEGGQIEGGRIVRITPDGMVTPLVENLPSHGDHHTNGPVVAPDGGIYFGVGTATNSGVVGEDNARFGWLLRFPDFHDIPCRDIVLAGKNFTTDNPLTPDKDDKATTGAFVPFGTPTEPNQVIVGRIPCSGAVFRIGPEGGLPELVAEDVPSIVEG
jgi:sugar lactone lactonase YvrE